MALSLYPWVIDAALLGVLIPALVFDLRERRIPHPLSIGGAVAGLALAAAWFGLGAGWRSPGLANAALGGTMAYALFATAALLGWMGGGDAALLGAVGTLLGYPQILFAMAFVAIAGGLQGVVAVVARTPPGREVCRRLGMHGTDQKEFGQTVPYGVSIVLGTIAFRIWQHVLAWKVAHPAQ